MAGLVGLNARVLGRERQSAAQIRLFDRYVVPPMAWVEERVRPPFRTSLFVVLERTEQRTESTQQMPDGRDDVVHVFIRHLWIEGRETSP